MTKYIPDIDEVDTRLQQVHGLAVADAVAAEPVRDERGVDFAGHISVCLEHIRYTLPCQLLMPVVEEQRSPEHIAAIETVLLHILLQMAYLLLHHGDNPCLAALPEEPYRVGLAVNADAVNGQVCNLLYPRTRIVHQREHSQMPAPLAGCDIRLLEEQADTLRREIVQRFLLCSHGLYGQYLLPFLGLLDDVVLQVRHKRMYGCQPVVPCGRGAMPLVKDPIEVSKDILPREIFETQSFDCNTFLGVHIVDILDEGISVCGQGVGTDIAFMGQIFGQEPTKLFGKVCRCHHRPCRVSGKQKRLSGSTAVPFRDTSRKLGGHIAPLQTANGAPDRQTI